MQNTSLMRLAVALGAGLSTGIQAAFFTLIGRAIGPARASLVLNLVGRILAGIILLAAIGIQGREHWNIPRSALVSATASVAMGLIIISGVAFSFPCMGVQQVLQLPSLGEMLIGVIVDTLGRAGRRPIPLDLGRFLGLIIMAIGELDDPEMVRVLFNPVSGAVRASDSCYSFFVRRRTMLLQTNFRQWIFKLGGGAAILGSLFAGVGNLLHPITPRDDPEGVAQVIAQSDHWTLIHLIIIFGVILMLAGLIAIRQVIEGGLPEALARLGVYAGTIGATVGLITVILDGVAAKALADQWAIAPESEKQIALVVVSANETINFALASLFNMSFAGIPFLLLGLAVALSHAFPRWLGWTAAAAGSGSIGAGLVQAFTGEPTVASLILTIIGPTVICLWLLGMGLLLLRNKTKRVKTSNREEFREAQL